MFSRIPIRIHPLFWVLAGLIGFLSSYSLVGTLVWIFVILVSVLVHELGHALTGLAFKQKVHIQLMAFGGATYREGPRLSLPKEFILTLNGPLAGIALGFLAYGIRTVWAEPPVLAGYALNIFVWVNFFWSIINLLPILPLDGGHLMRIICEGMFGAKGTSIALLASVILGAAMAVAGFIWGQILIGAVFFILTFESFRTWRSFRHMAEPDRDERYQKLYREGLEQLDSGNSEAALATFEQLRLGTGEGLLFVAATESAARLLAERGEHRKAFDYLHSVHKHLSSDSLPLYHKLAYQAGDYETAVKLGPACYQVQPGYEVAFVNALSHAALHDVEPTIGWLKCAIREGMPNPKQAVHTAEFETLKGDPAFEKFIEGIS
jgi:stage IV sporulation protein FB